MIELDLNAAPPGPRSHALIIGVGHYRHFEDGDDPTPGLTLQGGQLTSPPLGARAFADWLLTRYHHPTAPLATLELLVSSQDKALQRYRRPDTNDEIDLLPAEHDVAEQAFDSWRKRLARPDDVGLFFFSGHGLRRVNLALLFEDFGAQADKPFKQAVDFDRTWLGMDRCAARGQYYFIDACQSFSAAMSDQFEDEADAWLKPRATLDPTPVDGGVFLSAATNTKAYARPEQVSPFVRALIDGLEREGGDDTQGEWVVRPANLGGAIAEALSYLSEIGRIPKQRPQADKIGSEPLHVIGPQAPEFPVAVECRPSAALKLASLNVTLNGATVRERPPEAGPRWEIHLPPETYKLEATFSRRYQSPVTAEVRVGPPRRWRKLDVVRKGKS